MRNEKVKRKSKISIETHLFGLLLSIIFIACMLVTAIDGVDRGSCGAGRMIMRELEWPIDGMEVVSI